MYNDALNGAVNIAIDKNLDQIQGKTVILCDVSGSMSCPISGGKKYGSVNTCHQLGLILGMMIARKTQ